jgi:chromosome partitioning protein
MALAAREAGWKVVIVDVDPQRSARSWATAREAALSADDLPVIAADIEQLGAVVRAAADDGYNLVLVDTPPHSSAATAAVARGADLAIIPVRPSPL